MLNLLLGLLRWSRKPIPSGLVLTAIAILDPLGLSSASDQASRDMIQRVAAPFYDSTDRNVTVVLFDDASVHELGLHWPPPYRATVLLLRKILCGQPRALFVDLLFTHQHEADPNALKNLVLHLSGDRDCRSDAPVYVADLADQEGFDVPSSSRMLEPLRRVTSFAFDEQTSPIRRVPVNWAAPEGVYPLLVEVDPRPAAEWPTARRIGGRDYLPTPALALYEEDVPGVRVEDFKDPMVVRWGLVPQVPAALPDGFERVGECADLADGDRSPWSIAGTHFWWDLFHAFAPEDGLRQSCPYSFFVSAHTAYTGGSTREGGPLHELFNDRFVLIGTHLAGSGDVAVSPVHGRLPGVFLHAMALDNLLREHESYWRPMPRLTGTFAGVNARAAMTVGLFWLLFALNAWGLRPLRAELQSDGRLGLASSLVLIELVLAFLVLLAVSLILALWFHYAPLNWLGLLGLWLVAVATVRRELETEAAPAGGHVKRVQQTAPTWTTEASDA